MSKDKVKKLMSSQGEKFNTQMIDFNKKDDGEPKGLTRSQK